MVWLHSVNKIIVCESYLKRRDGVENYRFLASLEELEETPELCFCPAGGGRVPQFPVTPSTSYCSQCGGGGAQNTPPQMCHLDTGLWKQTTLSLVKVSPPPLPGAGRGEQAPQGDGRRGLERVPTNTAHSRTLTFHTLPPTVTFPVCWPL